MNWEVPTMQSKNLCCKPLWALIRKDLTRFWPVWGSYLAIWCLILPIPLLNASTRDDALLRDISRTVVGAGSETAVVMTGIYGILCAWAVWSYLHQGPSASLFHALPVSRGALFLSHYAAGLCFMVAPCALVALLSYLIQLSLGAADPTLLLQWFAITGLEGLLFFSIATLCAMCTGNLAAMPVLCVLVNFAAGVCETLIIEFSCSLYYGVQELAYHFDFLSPFIRLVNADPSVTVTYTEGGVTYYTDRLQQFDPRFFGTLLLYALGALAVTGCALLLYRRRATEAAGDVIAEPRLRPVAKYAFTLCCALVLGWIFDQLLFVGLEGLRSILLSCMLGAVIGWLAASMLLAKSFRVFSAKKLAGLLPVLALIGLWIGGTELDLFGVEGYVPAPEEVRSVDLDADLTLTLTDPEDIALVCAVHKQALELGEPDYTLPADQDLLSVRLTYTLKSGRQLRRSYRVIYSPALASDPGQASGKLSLLMSRNALDAALPPENARFESIDLNLHQPRITAGGRTWELVPVQTFDYTYAPVYLPHAPRLLSALREDVLAGRIGLWEPSWDKREIMMSISFSYDLPDPAAGSAGATRWHHLNLWADQDPAATLAALEELGYLRQVKEE